MPEQIELDRLEELLAKRAQVIDVLPKREYEEQHLPGAIHISLREFSEEKLSSLNKSEPVVVYCWDYQ